VVTGDGGDHRRRHAGRGVGTHPDVSPEDACEDQGTCCCDSSFGELDCNGHSTAQQTVAKTMNCTDVRGIASVDNANTWGGRFYDNGHYIGHDEPDMTFLSSQSGSGNDVT
jgi:hypothetical protein